MSSWKVAKPWRWNVSAPCCLPRPMAIIFMRPLSTSPVKSVCGLTRLIGTITSAPSRALRSTKTGTPGRTSPSSTVSMLDRISQPIDFGSYAVRGEDLELALRRGAAVAAHCRHGEDLRPPRRAPTRRPRGRPRRSCRCRGCPPPGKPASRARSQPADRLECRPDRRRHVCHLGSGSMRCRTRAQRRQIVRHEFGEWLTSCEARRRGLRRLGIWAGPRALRA